MSRTFRKPSHRLNYKTKKVRDGSRTHIAASCERNGGCPYCEGNRNYKHKKQPTLKEEMENTYLKVKKHTYTLNTIADICNLVTIDNVDNFTLDFYKLLYYVAQLKEKLPQKDLEQIEWKEFLWTDDDLNEVSIIVKGKEE